MIKRILYIASSVLMLAVCGTVSAQDLDPTVVVSRAYEGQLAEVNKPLFDMMVPDSVTRFELDFDYTVFEQPYKGSYEFNPYLLTMQPSSAVQNPKQLYLRAGAGYTLHPTLDLVWTPAFKGAFRMDVYAVHRSYVGEYRGFKVPSALDGVLDIDRWEESGGNHSYWKGYESMTAGGVDGMYDWADGVLRFDASYLGFASEDQLKKRHFDGLQAMLGVSSKSDADSTFVYDVQVDYSFGTDKMNYLGIDRDFGEHVFGVTAGLGRTINNRHRVHFDLGLDLASGSDAETASTVGQFHLTPHYVLRYDRWCLDAGLRLALLMNSDLPEHLYPSSGQVVYPDVKAWFDVLPGAMRLYARIGGGNHIDTYVSSLTHNRHFDPSYGHGIWPLMDVTVERVSASLGLTGRISSVFGYELQAGYVNYKNARLDAVAIGRPYEGREARYLPGFGYTGYQKFYAAADWWLKTESVRFDGNLTYTLPWAMKDVSLFRPSPFTGDVSVEYNWSRRIYVGVDCEFALARKGKVVDLLNSGSVLDARVPGYADLGVYAEIAANSFLSFWLRGGNLLNMTVQRNLLYAEKGVSFTAGICLNL